MSTRAIKLNTSIAGVNGFRAQMLYVLLMSFALLAVCYVFILGNMVWNIVERKSFETDVRTLSSEVGNLELEYLSLSNKVDRNLGYSLGFLDTEASFATRKSLGSLDTFQNEL